MNETAQGNLALLCERLADRAAARYLPEPTWAAARPLAQHAIRRAVPATLRALGEDHGLLYYLLQPWEIPWSQVPGTLSLPARAIAGQVPPASAFPAPPPFAPPGAPQTDAQMHGDWTPEQAAAASVAATQGRNTLFFDDLASRLEASGAPADGWLWIAAGVGAVALLVFLRGKQ